MEDAVNWWILIIPLAIAAFIALTAIKHVEEGNRLVVERLGRYLRIGGVGRHVLLPYIDRGIRVELGDRKFKPPFCITATVSAAP